MTHELALLLTALAGIFGTATFAILADVRGQELARRIERSRACGRHLVDALAGQEAANDALRACQEQMMHGAAVLRHKRPNPHRWADPELEVVRTDAGGLAFTDAEWSRARARYDAISAELPHT